MRFAHTLVLLFFSGIASVALAGTEPLSYEEQSLALGGNQRATARVPKGYKLEFVTPLDGPRLLTFAPNGDLFVGSKSGNVYRLPPPYTKPEVLVTLNDYPHSVAFRKDETANAPNQMARRASEASRASESARGPADAQDARMPQRPGMAGSGLDPIGEILIARTHGLYRAPYKPGQRTLAPKDVTLLAALPGGGGHNSRTVAVGPDGRVYLSLGIQGNCSDQYLGEPYRFDDRRGGILVLREEGGKATWEPYGLGLRNPVGFAWHPKTKELYASNNGPDHLGYDQPPEYFSRIAANSFHGMPWFQFDGKNIQRDDCVKSQPPRPVGEVVPPVATFPARNAPMGVAFVPAGALDKSLEFDAIVALRGSWGTKPGGGFFGAAATRRHPKVVAVRFKNGQAQRVDDLITGFQLPDGDRWARPVGVAVGPDGALYFTSDSDTNGLFRLKRFDNRVGL